MKRRTLASLPALWWLQSQTSPPAAASGGDESAQAGRSAAVTVSEGPFESPAVVPGNIPVFAEALKEELDFPLAWGTSPIRDFPTWRRTARNKVEELLCQGPDRTPFEREIVDERAADGYLRRRVLFNVTRHSRVHATMLVPDGKGPFPAVLLLHDHGSKFDIGKEKLVAPWYDEARLSSARAWADKYFGGVFVGDELARRGYVVLAVDALGWGDRSGLSYEAQQALASNFFNLGSSLAGLVAHEDVRAAALLATSPEVDRRRVAALGFSMGAFRAWQVAALSDHVRAAVAANWMTTLKGMMVSGNNTLRGQSAFFMTHPGLYRHLDIPDVATIAAPKPMMFSAGESDPLFTVEAVSAAYRRMRAVWRSQRADEKLHTKIWPGTGHVFTPEAQAESFSWLDTRVKNAR
ncbi:dienelactone hydrolase family protein [Saccharothrix deserti]|uniref:dienelactone hydrolase family protein n=1 Tax=Saccharothrix deserti TaxID=2593674 RepID=UPI00131B22A5|nr:alpha/beta hydrolase family protein [Saccharothrix deserti]